MIQNKINELNVLLNCGAVSGKVHISRLNTQQREGTSMTDPIILHHEIIFHGEGEDCTSHVL